MFYQNRNNDNKIGNTSFSIARELVIDFSSLSYMQGVHIYSLLKNYQFLPAFLHDEIMF